MKRCLSLLLLAFALAVPGLRMRRRSAPRWPAISSIRSGEWWSSGAGAELPGSALRGRRSGGTRRLGLGERRAPRSRHGRHAFNWAYDDLIVGEMAQAHLRWEPTLEFTPKWAEAHRPNVLHLKSGTVHHAAAAGQQRELRRLCHRVHAPLRRPRLLLGRAPRRLPYLPVNTVEVWNEPDNNHDWGPQHRPPGLRVDV